MLFPITQPRFIPLLQRSQQRITLSYSTMQTWVLFNLLHQPWQDFSEAADHTAATLADTWFECAQHTGKAQNSPSAARSQAQTSSTSLHLSLGSYILRHLRWQRLPGLDSSYLSPFLPESDFDPPHVYPPPPADIVDLDPHSEEYFWKLVAALDLDTDSYAHVDPTTLWRFKELIRKYPSAFYWPGTSLNTIKGFHHNIHTGDSPLVYRLPYRKSPRELAAIKDELWKILKLHINRPIFHLGSSL